MSDLKVFDTWYKAMIAVGAALAVAAVAAGHDRLLVIAIGMVTWGIGEFINHPLISEVHQQGVGGFNGVVSGRPHRPKTLGWILDIIGVALIAYALYRLVITI